MDQDQELRPNEIAEEGDSELSDADLENVAGGGQGGVKGPTEKANPPIDILPPVPAP